MKSPPPLPVRQGRVKAVRRTRRRGMYGRSPGSEEMWHVYLS